jgi:dihydroorotase
MDSITITKPDDWHLHLRDGDILQTVAPASARQFARALVMPNLLPAITSASMALDYAARIRSALPEDVPFTPMMALYLTENTTQDTVKAVCEHSNLLGFKLYPAGATTHSQSGVKRMDKVMAVLESMSEHRVPLQVHAEVTDPAVDIFDREAVFLDTVLRPIREALPTLKITVEHATTRDAIEFVRSYENTAATITAHHLLMNRNSMFEGGFRPHHYCLPVMKREPHRRALLEAAISGDPRFFLGTDSAPHTSTDKESACGCAGIYSANNALELYTQIFDQADALPHLEAFSSFYGADFYGVPRNTQRITLRRISQQVPEMIEGAHQSIVPFMAGKTLDWSY